MTMRGARMAALAAGLLVAITLGMREANAQDATVNVELSEWAVAPDPASVAAGDIEFVAENTGGIEHELVILKTDLAADALPTADGRVDEQGAGVEEIGEIHEVAAGATGSATFALAAGNYALICNIAGHYEAGMSTAFTVTAGAAPQATAGPTVTAPPATGTGLAASDDGLPVSVLALVGLAATLLIIGGSWAVRSTRRHIP